MGGHEERVCAAIANLNWLTVSEDLIVSDSEVREVPVRRRVTLCGGACSAGGMCCSM